MRYVLSLLLRCCIHYCVKNDGEKPAPDYSMSHKLCTWWRHQMETFSALLAISARSSPVTGDKGQWRGALMFSLICTWIDGWVNNREACDLRRHRAHYGAFVMGMHVIYLQHSSDLLHFHWDSRNIFLVVVMWSWRIYSQISNISRTKSQDFKCFSSRLAVVSA